MLSLQGCRDVEGSRGGCVGRLGEGDMKWYWKGAVKAMNVYVL